MSDTRRANKIWTVCAPNAGTATFDGAQLAVLMDLRDELQKLNQLLHCQNFVNIPRKLDRISANTAKPRKRRKP